ncbi:MAG TPA: DUF4136 domain-containing protein [Myxococcota bacterium]
MIRRGVAALALMALLLAGCSSIRVDTDFDPQVDFSALRSYAWLAESQPPTGDPRIDSDLLDARIRGAIDAQLAARGLQEAEASAADFLVAYHVSLERKLDVQTLYRSYGRAGWGGGGASETVVNDYEEGTLLVDFLRAGTGELLWRGSAETRLRQQRTPEARDAYVQKIVERLLGAYPPR